MKLTKIAQICKRHPHLRIFRTEQCQWISIGAAAYAAYGLPIVARQDELLSVLDVPTDKRDAFEVTFDAPKDITPFDDTMEGELPLRDIGTSFVVSGMYLRPMFTEDGRVYWMNECYLPPVEDEKNLGFWLREPFPGRYAVAAKAGYEIAALIGVRLVDSELEETIREVLAGDAMSWARGYFLPKAEIEEMRGYQIPVTLYDSDAREEGCEQVELA